MVRGTSGSHTWLLKELQVSLGIPADEIRRRLFTMGFPEVTPNRYPLKAKAFLKAQAEGKAICARCLRTGEPGICECRGRLRLLPDPESVA